MTFNLQFFSNYEQSKNQVQDQKDHISGHSVTNKPFIPPSTTYQLNMNNNVIKFVINFIIF